MDEGRTAQVTAVAALAEPTRRRLYDFVSRSAHPVSRDDVAAAMGVPRPTTAFHLDRLVREGLLDVHYERRTGRTGPGAGRPAKLYRRAECSVSVSLPERRYDLAGELLAGALVEAEGSGERPAAVLSRRAFRRGHELAAEVGATGQEGALRVLEELGFEPRAGDGGIALANCPFHTLAQEHPELVCGANLRLLEGVLDGVPDAALVATLRPEAGMCCVHLDPPAPAEPTR
jgi:predicted ArsR family transcriptional regulator